MGRLKRFTVPYPPSVNHYWHRARLSPAARRYRRDVVSAVGECGRSMEGAIRLDVLLHPPDQRRRDVDNPLKALLDALEHAGVYEDDHQVTQLRVERGEVVTGGRVLVKLEEVAAGEGLRQTPARKRRPRSRARRRRRRRFAVRPNAAAWRHRGGQ